MSASGKKKQNKPQQNHHRLDQRYINPFSKSHKGNEKERYLTNQFIPFTFQSRASVNIVPRMRQLQLNISTGTIRLAGNTGQNLTATERFALFTNRMSVNREYTLGYDAKGGFLEFHD